MTPSQAAKRIGCDVTHVRHLIRTGKIGGTATPLPAGGVQYAVTEAEVERFIARPSSGQGWPRGKSRKGA